MNWEHTHLAMAAGAGMLDQLRDEAASYRQSRELRTERRKSNGARPLRDRLATGYAAFSSLSKRRSRSRGSSELATGGRPSD